MAKRTGSAHVVTIKKTVNGREYRTDLLRRSYRDGKHVRNETLGNLTHLGPEKVEQVRRTLPGEKLVNIDDAFRLTDSRPHGHVSAVLSMARALEFERLIDRTASRKRSLALALVVHASSQWTPSSRRRDRSMTRRSVMNWVWAKSGPTTCMPPWITYLSGNKPSRSAWRAVICVMPPSCCTTCRGRTSRDILARLPCGAILETNTAAVYRSFTVCSAIATDV